MAHRAHSIRGESQHRETQRTANHRFFLRSDIVQTPFRQVTRITNDVTTVGRSTPLCVVRYIKARLRTHLSSKDR